MAKFIKLMVMVCMVVLSVYGIPYAQDDDGGGDSGGDVSDVSDSADVSETVSEETETVDEPDDSEPEDMQEDAETGDTGDGEDAGYEITETDESYEEHPVGIISQTDTLATTGVRYRRPVAVGAVVMGTAAGSGTSAVVRGASTTLSGNTRISDALAGGKLKAGMTKGELINQIGYPPDGTIGQGALFHGFTRSKVTAAGKEESWTYRISSTAAGVKKVTFTIMDGKVSSWNEWVDKK
ncbi:MAG: hypothetical protein JXB40_01830 [Candidatus Omnitrophica bacterium]|nr:hypothetical protein [Candidatus Omnitrophota bacterium]